ncbi:hypothetical protein BMI89_19640 [Thioclava sp. F36-7]|nr:hypothetical protein BMI89_19640 [Thioclava sp. F36-7]
MSGIIFINRNGLHWRDAPQEYGPPKTLYNRWKRWSEMGFVRPVMETHPLAWTFFVPFIMVTTFAVVNLLVGLIVDSMQDAHSEEETTRTGAYRDEVLLRLDAIERRIGDLRRGDQTGE